MENHWQWRLWNIYFSGSRKLIEVRPQPASMYVDYKSRAEWLSNCPQYSLMSLARQQFTFWFLLVYPLLINYKCLPFSLKSCPVGSLTPGLHCSHRALRQRQHWECSRSNQWRVLHCQRCRRWSPTSKFALSLFLTESDASTILKLCLVSYIVSYRVHAFWSLQQQIKDWHDNISS